MEVGKIQIQFTPVPDRARWQVLIAREITTLDLVSVDHADLDVPHNPDSLVGLSRAIKRRALEQLAEGNTRRIGAPVEEISVSSWELEGAIEAQRAFDYLAGPHLARSQDK
jgi:hypothetical protein